MGHFGESHLAPFRNSLVFSRRQRLQSGPVYRAMVVAYSSDPRPLRRAAAIMRNRGDVLDGAHLEAGRLQGPDRGLPAGAGALHEDVDLAHAMLHRASRRGLGGERRGLARALEADLARRRPGDDAAGRIGDRHDGVVEGALDMGVPVRDVLAFLAAHFLDAGTALGRHPAPLTPGGGRSAAAAVPVPLARARHWGLLLAGLLLAGHGLLLAFPGAGIGLRALAVHGKPAAVPDALIAADLHLAADVSLYLTAQVAFHPVGRLYPVPEADQIVIAELVNAGVAADAGRAERLERPGPADAVNIGT